MNNVTSLVAQDELEDLVKSSKIETDVNGVLRSKGRSVNVENNEEALECMKKLFAALAANEGALGVSAQQVGYDLNMFVAVVRGEPQLFINPTFKMIKPTKYTNFYYESCLSIPEKKFKVKRCKVIKARWQDAYRKWNERRFSDLDAVVFQHEYDHCKGILISDKGHEVLQTEGANAVF